MTISRGDMTEGQRQELREKDAAYRRNNRAKIAAQPSRQPVGTETNFAKATIAAQREAWDQDFLPNPKTFMHRSPEELIRVINKMLEPSTQPTREGEYSCHDDG